jgi:hypothetical protein
LPGQLCNLCGTSAVCTPAATHRLAHRHADGDAFAICYANALDQPDVVADVHAHGDPETNTYHAADSCRNDAVRHRYRDADPDLHAFARPGDPGPEPHVHVHAHTYANIHVDNKANSDVDAGSDANFDFHASAHVDANRLAELHAAPNSNTDRTACCHPYTLSNRQQLRPRSTTRSRLLGLVP